MSVHSLLLQILLVKNIFMGTLSGNFKSNLLGEQFLVFTS